jgi:hypothetical protein
MHNERAGSMREAQTIDHAQALYYLPVVATACAAQPRKRKNMEATCPTLMETLPDATARNYDVPLRLRVLAIVLRSIFVCTLLVVTVRVSTPQSQTIWSVSESLGDLIRVILGFVACAWIVAHLFMLPKDPEDYRTWVYLGLALAPVALACAIAVW